MPDKRGGNSEGGCQAANRTGSPCAAPPVRGELYCSIHLNPKRAADLGRKGGQNNRHIYKMEEQVEPPKSAADVVVFLAEIMAGVRNGQMDPKLGSVCGYLGTSLLRAFEVSTLEARIEKLEARIETDRPDK